MSSTSLITRATFLALALLVTGGTFSAVAAQPDSARAMSARYFHHGTHHQAHAKHYAPAEPDKI